MSRRSLSHLPKTNRDKTTCQADFRRSVSRDHFAERGGTLYILTTSLTDRIVAKSKQPFP